MKTPAMKTPALATIYLDNASVGLLGDPRPTVAKIVAAGGKQPGAVQVVRTQSSSDQKGKAVHLEDIIDRTTQPTQPIYLRTRPNVVSIGDPETAASAVFIEFPSSNDAGRKPLGSPLPDDSLLRDGRLG